MQFLNDYLAGVDYVAIAALVVLAIAAVVRRGSVWLWLLLVVIVLWAGWHLSGLA